MTGVILLDKPENITSFRALSQVRRTFAEKKAGHTGTLDPMASGLLPVMLGGATKFIELLPAHDKAYRATFLLGAETDTLDITGTVLRQRYVAVKEADVREALRSFRGRIAQTPPMYSALRQNGVRLYALARQGIDVPRQAREVEICRLELVGADDVKGAYTIDVHCSAGTYIRSLVSDIGETLGCGAVLTALRRTMAHGLRIEDAITPDALSALSADEAKARVVAVDRLLEPYPAVTVTEAQSARFCHGGALAGERVRGLCGDGLYRVYAPDGRFLGLGSFSADAGELAVRRLLIEK